jgi:hypothetical protein
MDSTEQAKWDSWARAHIKIALEQERDVIVDVFNGFRLPPARNSMSG